jgi:cytosine deaminase
MDLIIRHATLPDGRTDHDIGIDGARIVAVEPRLAASGAQEIDAAGQLVSPPFVDAHFHMDATLSHGLPRVNVSGTLLEGIALWGELKPELTQEAIAERALRYCDWAVARGLLAIRSHVDICDPRLLAVEALLEVKRRVAPYLDLQLVAFPQDGLLRCAGTFDNLKRAIGMGMDIVGGIPHFERTMAAGAESVRLLCEFAAQRGLRVDMHCDESDDPLSRHIETLAAPKRRGMTRVPELLAAGIDVAFGHDCVMDPWYGMGSGDMLEVAHMGLHVAQMTGIDASRACFTAVTETPARILGLQGYGIAPGCHADLVLLDARDPVEAIRLRAARVAVIRRGRVVSRQAPAIAQLALEGRPDTVDFKLPR